MLFRKPKTAAKPAPAKSASKDSGAPAKVNVATNPENGMRVVTIEVPQFHNYTQAELTTIETQMRKEIVGQCDVTGELIFMKKNANEIHNGDRPEFDKKIVSTKFLKALFAALNNTTAQA